MTIIDIKNQLISHFYDKSVFDLDVDGPKIQLDMELEGVRGETIQTVMNELSAMGMVKKVDSQEKSVWILTQSFDSFNQSLILSASASEIVGDTINQFRDANDITGDICDKTKITEADILNLINIVHVLLDSEEDTVNEVDPKDEEDN